MDYPHYMLISDFLNAYYILVIVWTLKNEKLVSSLLNKIHFCKNLYD